MFLFALLSPKTDCCLCAQTSASPSRFASRTCSPRSTRWSCRCALSASPTRLRAMRTLSCTSAETSGSDLCYVHLPDPALTTLYPLRTRSLRRLCRPVELAPERPEGMIFSPRPLSRPSTVHCRLGERRCANNLCIRSRIGLDHTLPPRFAHIVILRPRLSPPPPYCLFLRSQSAWCEPGHSRRTTQAPL